jgi:hypothetical protein
MNTNDGYIGFWYNDIPYFIKGDNYYNGYRFYLSDKPLNFNDCKKPISQYFRHNSDINTQLLIHRNGRRHYIKDVKLLDKKSYIVIPNLFSNTSLCKELQPFNDMEINLTSLICSQFSISKSWPELLSSLTTCNNQCTNIGRKIATSLIKIASLRIFADPEQSILELPVNSMDSYMPELRVGKYGMGFFSFLYWLINHPKRILYIYSWFQEGERYCGYCGKVYYNEKNGLMLKLEILETAVTQTGTLMYLDVSGDPFDIDIIVNFNEQMKKLKYTSDVKLYCESSIMKNTYTLSDLNKVNTFPALRSILQKLNIENTFEQIKPQYKKKFAMKNAIVKKEYTEKSLPPDTQIFLDSPIFNNATSHFDIYVILSQNKIIVEDYAKGISINVLLGSLFVPSISTKTIRNAIQLPNSWKAHNGQSYGFVILVSKIAVVSIPGLQDKTGVLIDMPPITQLPVSRDDIILNEVTQKYFIDNLLEVFELGKKNRNVSDIQHYCNLYIHYTSNNLNRQSVQSVLGTFFQNNIQYLITKNIFDGLSKIDKLCIESETMSIMNVEERLNQELKTDNNIWYGKKVVTIKQTSVQIEAFGMSSLIFVSEEYQKNNNWPIFGAQAFPNLNLAPVKVVYGTEKNDMYKGMIPKEIIGTENINLYMSVLAIYDGLSVYFKMHDDVYTFNKKTYQSIIAYFTIDEWKEISYAFLAKFAFFKGNKTYGGSMYNLYVGGNAVYSLHSQHFNKKFNSYRLQGAMLSIGTIQEENETTISISTPLVPDRIATNYFPNNEFVVQQKIHNFILEKSVSLIDYTICCVAFYKFMINSQIRYLGVKTKEINIDTIINFVGYLLLKIQQLNYTYEDLADLYKFYLQLPAYINKLTDECKEWWKIITNQQDYKIPIIPSKIYSQWTTFYSSQLLNYIFSNEPNINNLNETFSQVNKYDNKSKLQILEIAINEGTTKDFISAILTELTQNSVDAIRSTNPPVRNINITYTNTEDNTFTISVQDSVGMTPQAFLYIGIPFLSTKTPSELVTGEMGSGFFNVYRESSLVIIDTQYDGINYISYDIPIEENGRIVDIKRHIQISPKQDSKGTKIIIKSNKLDDKKRAEYLGLARYTSEKILAQISAFDDLKVNINGIYTPIVKKLMFTIGYFDIYFSENEYPSYIFTKSIPFSPLNNFYADYSAEINSYIENGIMVNIRSGGYTPIQSRTRINMPKEVKKQFEIVLNYIVFVKLMYDLVKNIAGPINNLQWIYQNLYSRGSAGQLKRQEWSVINGVDYKKDNGGLFFNYLNFNLLEDLIYSDRNTLVNLTNKAIDIISDRSLDESAEIRKNFNKELNTFNFSKFPEVEYLGKTLVTTWIKYKNYKPPKEQKQTILQSEEEEEVEELIIDLYVQIWIKLFIKFAIESNINGWNKNTVKNVKVVNNSRKKDNPGYFIDSSKIIYINTIMWTENEKLELINNVRRVKSEFDFQNVNSNRWKQYFSFRFPATVLCHELEHARRGTSHDNGHHDSINTVLWKDDVIRERSFDESSNDVFSKVISRGFYKDLLQEYKKAKLI